MTLQYCIPYYPAYTSCILIYGTVYNAKLHIVGKLKWLWGTAYHTTLRVVQKHLIYGMAYFATLHEAKDPAITVLHTITYMDIAVLRIVL
jgi:hypothetical protein